MSRTITIGVHMHQGRERTRRTIEGVLEYALEHDIVVRNFNYLENQVGPSEQPPWLGLADGIVTEVGRVPGTVPFPVSSKVPVVNAASDLCREVPSVFANAVSLAKLAADHFLDLGLRNFAYVGYRRCDGSLDRCRALAVELARHKFRLHTCQTDTVFTGTLADFSSLDEVEPTLVRLVQRAKKTLGVLTMSDGWAAMVCRIAHELGLAVPDDVAVLGVGDSDLARVNSPPISSIRTPIERMGYEAARLVHRMIRGEVRLRKIVKLPVRDLIPRESTTGKRRAVSTDMQRALHYIRQNACQGIRIQNVAEHVHVPLRTFEIQFAAAVGYTVGEAVRRERLERAKSLLATTDLPLATVAHQCGFNAAANLNDFFRRQADMTPTDYRQKHRRGNKQLPTVSR